MAPPAYPFSAVVGQEQMRLALVLNAINPRLGGVLIRGEKGTAKTTAARGIAALLPALQVVEGCRFACDPAPGASVCPECAARKSAGESPLPASVREAALVELPIGATEDRVLGTLDLERALKAGERHFDPGLLARANRGLLYVDEVNLLPDHLVDALLDAAATGVNTVEREGLSFSHPAAFVLIGTMNPEEGELRPQLLDRFALAVDVSGTPAPVERAEVVRRRIAYEAAPLAFADRWRDVERGEQARIATARAALPRVQVDDRLLDLIASICTAFQVDGLRADIVIYKAAATLAAYAGRQQATAEDVRRAAELALPHRRRRQPFDQPGLDRDRLDELIENHTRRQPDADPPPDAEPPPDDEEPGPGDAGPGRGHAATNPDAAATDPEAAAVDQDAAAPGSSAPAQPEHVFEVGPAPPLSPTPANQTSFQPPSSPPQRARAARRGSLTTETTASGRHLRSVPPSPTLARPLDVAATLLAAAPHQLSRKSAAVPAVPQPTATLSRTSSLATIEPDASQQVSSDEQPTATHTRGTDATGHVSARDERPTTTWSRTSPLEAAIEPDGLLHGSAANEPTQPNGTGAHAPNAASTGRLRLEACDVRVKVRQEKVAACTLFVVDASGSMAARRRMAAAKGAVASLLTDAYQQRTKVGLIAFRGTSAELLLPPTSSPDLAYARLRELPTGGRTPLALALTLAHSTLFGRSRQASKRPFCSSHSPPALVVLVSDCRANVGLHDGDPLHDALAAAANLRAAGFAALVVDSEEGPVRLGFARRVCDALGGHYLRLADLPAGGAAQPVAAAVRVLNANTERR